MAGKYNLDEIKTEIKKDMAMNSAFIEAWEKVTFPTKKDGKPFAVMSKNISGAKYTLESYAMQPGEYELTVYTHNNDCGYIYDTIKAHELIRYMKDETMLSKTENYMPEQSYLEQVYCYDIEDIKNAVQRRIDYLKEYNKDLENQLASIDNIFHNFRNAYDAAIKQLKSDCAVFNHTNTYYAVKDTVINRYPYV